MVTKIDLFEVVTCLSDALNLTGVGAGIDWGNMSHGTRVCYISSRIAEQMHLDEKTRSDLYYTALLHDCGISTTREFKDIIQVDTRGDFSHCRRGYKLLKRSPYTAKFAKMVLHHHDKWTGPNESGICGDDIPICSRIIFLADRVDILMRPREYILHQSDKIIKTINERSVSHFDPNVVGAFNHVALQESFWLDLTSRQTEELLRHYWYRPQERVDLDYDQFENIAEILAQIVDSKSTFTLQHSRKVAKVAVELAEMFNFSPFECEKMKIAGLLHDLGKLSIPDEILDKADKLTVDEYEIIKRHTYFTNLVLDKIMGFETIRQWASLHHERLDGRGYPFHTTEKVFPLGARILAVSDTFTAISEDRPYRKGYPTEKVCEILRKCVSGGALDAKIVGCVVENIDKFRKLLEAEQPDDD
ncbi:MAG TPA: HD-GYP domain-containing protein [Candidatus Avalokitesvara rifleensis]|uniref:HD-GYP domain-containing protein n=1 Tax=Candidatus Avalokitesvara rifleensis TaxID=3367620 RepID=UPI0027135213|nr:HD domain-containing protein [Candidatus Brocadiales bacterium]